MKTNRDPAGRCFAAASRLSALLIPAWMVLSCAICQAQLADPKDANIVMIIDATTREDFQDYIDASAEWRAAKEKQGYRVAAIGTHEIADAMELSVFDLEPEDVRQYLRVCLAGNPHPKLRRYLALVGSVSNKGIQLGSLYDAAYLDRSQLTVEFFFRVNGRAPSPLTSLFRFVTTDPSDPVNILFYNTAERTLRIFGSSAPPRSIPDNDWHHVAVCADLPAQTAAVYLDGAYIGSHSFRTGSLRAVALRFGDPYSSHFLPAVIDDVRVSQGIRYADNFAPPVNPHVIDESTVAYWSLDANRMGTHAENHIWFDECAGHVLTAPQDIQPTSGRFGEAAGFTRAHLPRFDTYLRYRIRPPIAEFLDEDAECVSLIEADLPYGLLSYEDLKDEEGVFRPECLNPFKQDWMVFRFPVATPSALQHSLEKSLRYERQAGNRDLMLVAGQHTDSRYLPVEDDYRAIPGDYAIMQALNALHLQGPASITKVFDSRLGNPDFFVNGQDHRLLHALLRDDYRGGVIVNMSHGGPSGVSAHFRADANECGERVYDPHIAHNLNTSDVREHFRDDMPLNIFVALSCSTSKGQNSFAEVMHKHNSAAFFGYSATSWAYMKAEAYLMEQIFDRPNTLSQAALLFAQMQWTEYYEGRPNLPLFQSATAQNLISTTMFGDGTLCVGRDMSRTIGSPAVLKSAPAKRR